MLFDIKDVNTSGYTGHNYARKSDKYGFAPINAGPPLRSSKLDTLELLEETECRLAEESLHAFLHLCWPIIEPGRPFIDNWHLRAICEHLEAVSRRQIKRLVINVPFRTSKSTITSVAWPAWTWISQPNHQWLCGSYAEKLAIRDSLKMRRLVTSPWYQEFWGDRVTLTSDQNEKRRFQNDRLGHRIAFGMTGGVMGDGGDTLLLDDPHDRQGAHSEAERETALDNYDQGMVTRLNDPDEGAIVVIMQRLHQKDLAGHVLEQGGWEHLMLPMEFEKRRACVTNLGFKDPRSEEGELLWPERFSAVTVDALKVSLGDYGSAGQLQQRPSPAGGGILQVDKIRLWPAKEDLPDLFFVLQSYDTAFTEKTENDATACTVWGIGERPNSTHDGMVRFAILLDAWIERLGYPALRKKALVDWKAEYGGIKKNPSKPSRRADVILVEDKGSGQSLLQDLRAAGLPAKGYNPGKADKLARAHLVAPLIEAGLVYVLESKREPGLPVTWARPLLTHCEEFPNGEHDDDVDTFTQALIYLRDAQFLELAIVPADEPGEIDYPLVAQRRANPYDA